MSRAGACFELRARNNRRLGEELRRQGQGCDQFVTARCREPRGTGRVRKRVRKGTAVREMAVNDREEVREPEHERSRNETDLLLLERIATGDNAALRELYLAYYHPLLRFMGRMTGNPELAKEGVNDVMLTVWRSTSFERRSTVSTWIMGIAYRKALKLLEANQRWWSRFGSNLEDFADRPELGVEPREHADLRDMLDKALRELSPEQRAVVELTYFNGCSYEEIAGIAGCPVNTVKTRMFHARAKLRRLLPALALDEQPSKEPLLDQHQGSATLARGAARLRQAAGGVPISR